MLTLEPICMLMSVLTMGSPVLSAPVGSARVLSNAKRMQLGLPLKTPKRLYDPTRTRALVPRASAEPESGPVSVYIQVYDPLKRGLSYRYIATDDDGYLAVVSDPDDKSLFTLPSTSAPTGEYGYELDGEVTGVSFPYGIMGTDGDWTWDYVTSISTADNGEPIGASQQSSIWQIDGTPSAVSANFYNSTNSYPLYWFLDTTPDKPLLITSLYESGANIDIQHTDQVNLRWVLA